MLQDIRSRCELYRFDTPEGFHIDVTHLLPDEAAREILAYINVRVQPNELEFGDGMLELYEIDNCRINAN